MRFENPGVQRFAPPSVVDQGRCVQVGGDGVEGQLEVVQHAVGAKVVVQLAREAEVLAGSADAEELGGFVEGAALRAADEEDGRVATDASWTTRLSDPSHRGIP
ncbi:hypothetical protein OG800_13685 [Streptomyces sp. NBC_00445]|uniref:hypothetical protein n=1 Tax=Streptomyces sp. NBC_00445 TaxID=2975745 RepID=UPI002E1BC00E